MVKTTEKQKQINNPTLITVEGQQFFYTRNERRKALRSAKKKLNIK